MMNPAINEILSDSLYFPFQLLADRRIGYLRISEDTFNRSPFLDRRIQGADKKMFSLSALAVDNQLKELKISTKKDLIHIFHISHVGSTLVSRLLESLDETKVLREPNILRDLTQEFSKVIRFSSEYKKFELDSLLSGILKSFLFGKESKVVIKHTSSNLSLPLGHNHMENIEQKEILLYTGLQNFLLHSVTSIGLKGDAEGSAQNRLNQLNKICFSNFFKLDDLQYLEMVSLIWMVEFSKLLARKASNENALLINFDDDFQENKKEETAKKILKLIYGNFNSLEKTMHSKNWYINAKNGKEYSFKTRQDNIKKNKLSNIEEIERTLGWVEGICKEEPYLLPLLNYIK